MDLDNPVQSSSMDRYCKQDQTEEDRISHLPDDILIYILALIPIRYSIRTSILSRKWEHLWAFAPKLDIEYKDNDPDMLVTFSHSIDTLLLLRGNSCIESFRLCFKVDVDPPGPISWIRAVLACNLTQLDIETIPGGEVGELPGNLFTCKTLVVVKIVGYFVLKVPYYVCLPNLKTLILDGFLYMADAAIQKFLSGCPVLEDLQLILNGLKHMLILDASFSSLKRLTLAEYFFSAKGNGQIKVDAPNLEFIELSALDVAVFVNVSSLSVVEACLDITEYLQPQTTGRIEFGNKALTLLRSFANVRRLSLSGRSCQSLFYANEAKLPIFYNLVRLEIDFDLCDGLPGPVLLMDLLDGSPKLGALLLPKGLGYFSEDDSDGLEYNPEYYWTQPELVPECLLHSLKSIRLVIYEGQLQEIEVVTYLLQNALALEKMTISCCFSTTSKKFEELEREIANLPRGSADCQLVLLSFLN